MRREGPNRTREAGFTLTEIVTVVIFISLLLLPVVGTLLRAMSVSNDIERLSVAAFLAVEKMEETRLRGSCYSVAGQCPGVDADPTSNFVENLHQGEAGDPDTTCGFPAPYDNYKCTVDYYDSGRPGTAVDRLRDIRVRVWFDLDGDSAWDSDEPDVWLENEMVIKPPDW